MQIRVLAITLAEAIRRRAFPLAVVALVAGCGGSDTTPPAAPTPTPVTDTFTGTLTRNGAVTHLFATTLSGNITATITSLAPESTGTPDTTIVIGMALGTWNGADCQIAAANDQAAQGAVIVRTASSLGNFCLRLYDAKGTLAEPTSYEVKVEHP